MIKLMRRYPLLSFFLIAYAVSWTYVLVFLVFWPLPDTIVTQTPELFGPILAGFVMTAIISGKAGVKQLLRRFVLWRAGAVWYLFVLVGIPAIYFLSIAFVPGVLGSFKAPTVTMSLLYPVLFLVVLVLDGPLFEEPGWRGFALPRLQERWGPLVGSVILGVLWAAWHTPQYLLPSFASENGGFTASGLGIFALAAISFSVIITWVFNHTRGSLLIAILLHTAINFSQGLSSDLFPAAKFNEVGPVIAFGLTALVIVVATRGRLGYGTTKVGSAAPTQTAAPAASPVE